MADFSGSTLWRISAFERQRTEAETRESLAGAGPTLLPTTLLADLDHIRADPTTDDVLEVVAACLRHREPALLYLALGAFVWPVTLFPRQKIYHTPRDVIGGPAAPGLATVRLLSAERPGVRPPGHVMHERVAAPEKYLPIEPLLWALALHGPRADLLRDIGGRAAYRLAPGRTDERWIPPGALGPAMLRLRVNAVSVRDMSRWPGMTAERACRLLNALYLTDTLMVTRSHPNARHPPSDWRDLLRRRR